MNSVCLAVLNYNGIQHLEALLPSLEAACRQSPVPASPLILDNRSTQGDMQWMTQHHPSVRYVVAPKNDYLFSYNWLLAQLKDEVVVLLNNDLRVKEDFLAPLLRHLEAPDVFAVSASSYDWDGQERTIGPARLTFRNGFYDWTYDRQRQELCHTLFTSGGFMAVDRSKFLELDGFNRLFYPAYCEDLDLCFRAWRQGWRCVYEPASIVWHRERASWAQSQISRPNRLQLRNALLFQWSTLPMARGRKIRWKATLKILAGSVGKGDLLWLKTLLQTTTAWRRLRKKYSWMKTSRRELDSILARLNQPC